MRRSFFRRRAVRELGTILGVVAILVAVVFASAQLRRASATTRYEEMRVKAEDTRRAGGLELLEWKLLKKTKGTRSSGPTFHPDLAAQDGTIVQLVGFMVPLYDFTQIREFILLPLPIQCYFCSAPPMREVVIVQMAEGQKISLFQEPIMINGTLRLHSGPNTEFWYTIEDSKWGPAVQGQKMHEKSVPMQHKMDAQEAMQKKLGDSDQLLEPVKPSAGAPPQ